MNEHDALKLLGVNQLSKRQYAYFVLDKKPACKCINLDGFMIKWDCGSPLQNEM